MAKQPSFQFYPGDWMKDPDLRRCSLFARGLLADLLCICFESSWRGRLCERDGVTPWSDNDILRSVGENNDEGREALAELLRKNVLSRDATGCLTSRRMVRDEELRVIRAASGHEGGKQSGSKTPSKPPSKREANDQQTDKQKAPPSSSSSASAVNPPISPKGDLEVNRRRRKRDQFEPPPEDRSEKSVKAWIRLHPTNLIPRDATAVDYILKAAATIADPNEFLSEVDRITKGKSP